MADTADAIDEGYDDLDDQGGLSGFWILIIFIIILAAFSGIVYTAYQNGMARGTDTAALPAVVPEQNPVRSDVPFPRADGMSDEAIDELDNPQPDRVVATRDEGADPLADFDSSAVTPVDVPTREEVTALATGAATSGGSTTPQRPASEPTPATTSVTRPAVTTPATREPAATVPSSTPAAGTWAVQVGAFDSRDAAMERYGQLMRQYGSMIGDQPPTVPQATVNGRVYHRLWIGEFGNRGPAQQYCTQLQGRGLDCLVRQR